MRRLLRRAVIWALGEDPATWCRDIDAALSRYRKDRVRDSDDFGKVADAIRFLDGRVTALDEVNAKRQKKKGR